MLPNYLYWAIYGIMIASYATLSVTSMPTPKDKLIGILLTVVNALLFWKG